MKPRFKEGDKSKAICEKCKKIVITTFRFGKYKIPGTKVEVPKLLQGYCDQCQTPLSLPHQSVPTIQKFLQKGLQSSKQGIVKKHK